MKFGKAPPLKRLRPTDSLLLPGMKGSGKTYYANKLVRIHSTVGIWDVHRNYEVGYFPSPEKVPPGAQKWGVAPQGLVERNEFKAAFSAFVEQCRRRKVELIVVDEVSLLTRDTGIANCEAQLAYLALQARHFPSAVVFIHQRLFGIPPATRSQVSEIVTFQQVLEHDIQCYVRLTGDNSALDPVEIKIDGKKKIVPRIAALPTGECLHATVRSVA